MKLSEIVKEEELVKIGTSSGRGFVLYGHVKDLGIYADRDVVYQYESIDGYDRIIINGTESGKTFLGEVKKVSTDHLDLLLEAVAKQWARDVDNCLMSMRAERFGTTSYENAQKELVRLKREANGFGIIGTMCEGLDVDALVERIRNSKSKSWNSKTPKE